MIFFPWRARAYMNGAQDDGNKVDAHASYWCVCSFDVGQGQLGNGLGGRGASGDCCYGFDGPEREKKKAASHSATETRVKTCRRFHPEELYAGREAKLKVIGTLHEACEA